MPATMNRREVIKRTALLMGTAVSAPMIMAILKGCKSEPVLGWQPLFFTKEQAQVVSRVADIILPKTDSPAASELGVPAFIEQMVQQAYGTEDRERFMSGLDAFASGAGKPFGDLSNEEQEAHVRQTHDQAINEELTAVAKRNGKTFDQLSAEERTAMLRKAQDGDADEEKADKGLPYKRPFITMMKELTLLGYFTSETGATQVLQYAPVPGAYFGCQSLAEAGGKTWAT